jgi:xylan 1,4-beta-xylosidase
MIGDAGRYRQADQPTQATGVTAAQARAAKIRADWEQRIYRRLAESDGRDGAPPLPAPEWVTAEPGAGHIRLSWAPVAGAAGYAIERAGGDSSEPQILRHGGSDVAAVAGSAFADTGVADETEYRYRVGAVAAAEHPVGSWSQPVTCMTATAAPGPVVIDVDAASVSGQLHRVWHMVGAERLSQLRDDGSSAGARIAAEFGAALRLAHTDLGVTMVRAHAILHDDNEVARRDETGALRFDFSKVDAIYDQLLEFGLRPVVELSFMPAALARDPEQTVFTYRGIISPPRDWGEWRQLVTELTAHLVRRYGADEVARWAFEVWNEPNLVVFWPGSREDYLRLYSESALAVKAVDPRLRIGGPATAAGEWIELLAAYTADTGLPLDFVSTHTYGNLPLDVRPALRRHELDSIPIWWTEWGAGSTHFGAVHDSALGAPFVLSGFYRTQGRVDALAYWVISDHFEELGRPPRLFHNGFGLLSVGNLRKPRYWAAHLAAHMGDQVLSTGLEGDGANTLVQAWASRHADGTVDVLIWNGTINAALIGGDTRLDRHIRLTVAGLDAAVYQPRLARVDALHSNVVAHCPADVIWPDAALWERLRDSDGLHEERLPDITPDDAAAHFDFHLPMPGVVRIRLATGQLQPGLIEESHDEIPPAHQIRRGLHDIDCGTSA